MSDVKHGDTIRIHYTGTLADGSVFDSSEGRDPLEFAVGSGQIIPGLDAAMPGMTIGETKVVDVPHMDAYGARQPDRQQAVPRTQIPDGIPVDPGTQLQMKAPNGSVVPVVVVEANDDEVVLDANHPLAGKDLTFKVTLVEIL